MSEKKSIFSLSPSAAARWITCPGSEYIIRQLPRLPSTPAAEEGTLAHEFAAWMLAGTLHDALEVDPVSGMPKEPEQALVTDEMLSAAQIYADSVMSKVCEVFGGHIFPSDNRDGFAWAVEYQCEYESAGVKFKGRLDFCATARNVAIMVADFKFGGEAVPTKDNPQLLTYAICLAEQCLRAGESLPPKIIIGIIQPRSEITDFGEYGAVWYEYNTTDFVQKSKEIKAAARTACNADNMTERATGPHCKYCAARSVCRAAIGEKLLLAAIAAGESQMAEDANDVQIGAWLDALKEIENVRDDLVRIAKARIQNGEQIPGWRLQFRKSRQWNTEIQNAGTVYEQAELLSKRLNADIHDFISSSLKSPTQMAKTMPKEVLASVIEETTTTALVAGGAK